MLKALAVFFPLAFSVFSDMTLFADGMILTEIVGSSTEESNIIEEGSQRVFIYYDPLSLKERIVIEVETQIFQGGFAWVIPLPYVPVEPVRAPASVAEIDGGTTAFDALEEISASSLMIVKHYMTYKPESPSGFGCACAGPSLGDSGEQAIDNHIFPVDIWQEGVTESFSYVHLSGGTVAEIAGWLHSNGYGSLNEATGSLLSVYSAQGFSFVVLKADKVDASVSNPCISITFPSDKAFFPLAISALGTREPVNITLYVCSTEALTPDDECRDLVAEGMLDTMRMNFLDRNSALHLPSVMSLEGIYPNYNENDLQSDAFQQELSLLLARWAIPFNTVILPTSFFWQHCALTIQKSSEALLWDTSRFPFLLGFDQSTTLWVGKFSRAYTGNTMKDVRFHSAPQTDFYGLVVVHVNVRAQQSAVSVAFFWGIPPFSVALISGLAIWFKPKRRIMKST
jgi:hypothetical protein